MEPLVSVCIPAYNSSATIAGTIVLSILVICNMVRKKRLELKYALVWFQVGCVVLIFDIFPQLLSFTARIMGVGLPVNMLFFLGFIFSLLIIFTLTVAVSKMSEKVKRLTQEMALLEEKLREVQAQDRNKRESLS